MKLKYHIDKVGIIGSIVSSLCCLGFPAIISFLSAIGATFLINDAILLPLLLVSLIISVSGIFVSFTKHKKVFPPILSIVSAIITFVFLFVVYVKILIYVGLIGLIVASVINSMYIKKCEAE